MSKVAAFPDILGGWSLQVAAGYVGDAVIPEGWVEEFCPDSIYRRFARCGVHYRHNGWAVVHWSPRAERAS